MRFYSGGGIVCGCWERLGEKEDGGCGLEGIFSRGEDGEGLWWGGYFNTVSFFFDRFCVYVF